MNQALYPQYTGDEAPSELFTLFQYHLELSNERLCWL
jgi:hypothetical protein